MLPLFLILHAKEGGTSGECNRGVISPVYKKGEKNKVKKYRGVTQRIKYMQIS